MKHSLLSRCFCVALVPILVAAFQLPFSWRGNGYAKIKSPVSMSAKLNAASAIDLTKAELFKRTAACEPNGLRATANQRIQITDLVEALEKLNPTSNPALSEKMNGFWRMLYTDFTPAAASSGKLGPFVGDVFQDLDSKEGIIKNILKIGFPPVSGALVANMSIYNKRTWQIEFDRIGNAIIGIQLPTKYFKKGDQIRLWEITYLDTELRIMRARRPEVESTESFIFILRRDEDSRFSIAV